MIAMMAQTHKRRVALVVVTTALSVACAIEGGRGGAHRHRGRSCVFGRDARVLLSRVPRGGETSGGAKKSAAKVLDPTGTPLIVRAARPIAALAKKYDALVEEQPKVELYVQVGVTMLAVQLVNRMVKKYGESPFAVMLVRAAYLAFLLLHQAVLSAVQERVLAADDTTPLSLPGNPLLASLASSGALKEGPAAEVAGSALSSMLARETTVKEYDLDVIKKGRNSQLGTLLFLAYVHLKKGYLQPVVLSTVFGLTSLLREPLVQIHLLGRDPEGALARPFTPPVPAWLKALQDQQQQQRAVTEDESGAEAAAEEAEEEEEEDEETDEGALDEEEDDEDDEEDDEDEEDEDVEEDEAEDDDDLFDEA